MLIFMCLHIRPSWLFRPPLQMLMSKYEGFVAEGAGAEIAAGSGEAPSGKAAAAAAAPVKGKKGKKGK